MFYLCADGNDFIGVEESFQHTVTFSSGETTEIMIIRILDDTVFEGNELFYATLTTTDSDVVIIEPNATVHIIENDGESTLSTTSVSVLLKLTFFQM